MRSIQALLGVFALFLASASADAAGLELETPWVARGGTLVIKRQTALPANATPSADLCLDTTNCSNPAAIPLLTTTVVGTNRLELRLGGNALPGRYRVRLKLDDKTTETTDALVTVLQTVIDSVAQPEVIGEGGRRTFVLYLNGSGFAHGDQAATNRLIFRNHGILVPCRPVTATDTSAGSKPQPKVSCVTVEAADDGSAVTFRGIPDTFAGADRIRVQAGAGGDASNEVQIDLPQISRVQEIVRGVLLILAVIGFTGGLLLALRSVRVLRNSLPYTPKPSLFEVVLLDPKTQTYSLANFQLVAWSGVFLVAYCYLFVGRLFWQNGTDLIDLPGDFAAMLGATAGTSVASTAITNTRGSKGSGEIHPALSDLVSNGGVFAPERFQFLIWTIVGIIGYLMLTFRQSLDSVTSLPQVSQGFLAITGVSSLAYLGGKLFRVPGPVISSITPQPPAAGGQPVFRVIGENLSISGAAKYSVEDANHQVIQVMLDSPTAPSLRVVTKGNTPDFATELELRLKAGFAFPGTFTITNPDQQKAVQPFQPEASTAQQPRIVSVAPAQGRVAGAPYVFHITGDNLSANATFTVQDATNANSAVQLNAANPPTVTIAAAGSAPGLAAAFDLTLSPTFQLPGRLTITNPDGQQVTAPLAP